MAWLLRFATSRLGIGVIAGLLASAIILGVVLAKNGEIRALERQAAHKDAVIRQLAGDYARCQSNRAALEAAIGRQNDAIATMARQGAARVAELDRVAADARRAAESAEARARRILGRRSSGDVCADARALVLESVR